MGATGRQLFDPAATERPTCLSDWFREVDRTIVQVLCEVRLRDELARCIVTRELGLEPRPGTLRAIVRVARDTAIAGPRYALPRRLLALHVLVDRELGDLLDSPRVDVERLQRANRHIAELTQAARKIEADLRDALASCDADDTAFLTDVADALAISEDRLVAATVIAPRLELLIEARGGDDVRTAVPALTDDEAALLTHAWGEQPADLPGCRAAINAVALRTLIEEDVERLASLDSRPASGSADRSRGAVLDRLRRDVIAYRVIDDRLAERQDAAITARLERFAAEIGRIKSALFATWVRLLPALRRATS